MNIKLRVTALFIFVLLLFTITISPSAKTLQGKVVKVVDGDTITMLDGRGFRYRIRLAGIDAPEKGQPYGKESTKNLKWHVYGKEITVEHSKYDRYGRIVGKVLIDSNRDMFCLMVNCIRKVDVGLEQINAGTAWHYKRYKNKQSKEDRTLYSTTERGARKKQLGLWSDKKPTPPWEWRKNNKLEALRKRFNATGAKEKTYAMALRMDPDQLKKFLNEAIWNAFKASGLEEEEFAVEFQVSPDKLKNIIESKGDE